MEIVWRPIALEDLDDAHRYIERENPAAANRIRNAILSAVDRLADHPNIGRPGRVDETRELVAPEHPTSWRTPFSAAN